MTDNDEDEERVVVRDDEFKTASYYRDNDWESVDHWPPLDEAGDEDDAAEHT